MNTKNKMYMYAYHVIKNGANQKKYIADALYDYWEMNEGMSKEFVMLFRDLGWMFQDLKLDGVIRSNGLNGTASRWWIT